MSKPFIFRPTPDMSPHNSPFIPPSPFLPHGTPSPFNNIVQLPPSPNLLPIHFPQSASSGVEFDPEVGWRRHARTPSWNGQAGLGDGLLSSPSFNSRPRTQSFGGGGIGSQRNLGALAGGGAVPLQYHPWLEGREPRQDLWFDLSMGICSPRRITRIDQMGVPGAVQVPISEAELSAPATNPPVSGMRVVLDNLPQYPIDIVLQQSGTAGLTVGHVFQTIYRAVQQPIEQADFDALSEEGRRMVSNVYRKRCHALGAMEQEERKKGVKRVDFLLGKVLFRGLVPDGQRVRVVVA